MKFTTIINYQFESQVKTFHFGKFFVFIYD